MGDLEMGEPETNALKTLTSQDRICQSAVLSRWSFPCLDTTSVKNYLKSTDNRLVLREFAAKPIYSYPPLRCPLSGPPERSLTGGLTDFQGCKWISNGTEEQGKCRDFEASRDNVKDSCCRRSSSST